MEGEAYLRTPKGGPQRTWFGADLDRTSRLERRCAGAIAAAGVLELEALGFGKRGLAGADVLAYEVGVDLVRRGGRVDEAEPPEASVAEWLNGRDAEQARRAFGGADGLDP